MTAESTRTDREGESRPRFCPGCRRARRGESGLCAFCGDSLVDQGFCPVCRQHWLLPEEALCPKHDLGLGQAPSPGDFPTTEGEVPSWATLATFAHAIEAQGPRLRLEAEGIPTFLDGERMAGHSGAVAGGVRLQVPRSRIDDAREILDAPGDWDEEEDPGADRDLDASSVADPDLLDAESPPSRGLLRWALGLFLAVVVIRGLVAVFGL